jgi:hypothetical protein
VRGLTPRFAASHGGSAPLRESLEHFGEQNFCPWFDHFGTKGFPHWTHFDSRHGGHSLAFPSRLTGKDLPHLAHSRVGFFFRTQAIWIACYRMAS